MDAMRRGAGIASFVEGKIGLLHFADSIRCVSEVEAILIKIEYSLGTIIVLASAFSLDTYFHESSHF